SRPISISSRDRLVTVALEKPVSADSSVRVSGPDVLSASTMARCDGEYMRTKPPSDDGLTVSLANELNQASLVTLIAKHAPIGAVCEPEALWREAMSKGRLFGGKHILATAALLVATALSGAAWAQTVTILQ